MKSLRQRSDVIQCAYQQENFSGNGEKESLEEKRLEMEIIVHKLLPRSYINSTKEAFDCVFQVFNIKLKKFEIDITKKKGGKKQHKNRYYNAVYILPFLLKYPPYL